MKLLCIRITSGKVVEDSLETIVRANGGAPLATQAMVGPAFERVPSPLYGPSFKRPAFSQAALNMWTTGVLEAVLFEPTEGARNHSFANAASISTEDDLHRWGGKGLVVIRHESLVAAIGGAFFRHIVSERPEFRTSNASLFDSLYLPIELARDGTGIFFQDRLASRIRQIGLIDAEDEILLIEDHGGWSSVAKLTATIAVTVERKGMTRTEVLLAHALVPAPPIRPEVLSASIDSRRRMLASLGVRTSVLECIPGVVYERGLVDSVVSSLRKAKGRAARTVVTEAAQLIGLRDAGVFEACDCLVGLEQISTDFVELSADEDVQGIANPSVITCLRTDGTSVYWSDLRRPLSAYTSTNGQDFEVLTRLADPSLHDDARNAYLAGLAEGRQLIGTSANETH